MYMILDFLFINAINVFIWNIAYTCIVGLT